jgi:hypothetical protein
MTMGKTRWLLDRPASKELKRPVERMRFPTKRMRERFDMRTHSPKQYQKRHLAFYSIADESAADKVNRLLSLADDNPHTV